MFLKTNIFITTVGLESKVFRPTDIHVVCEQCWSSELQMWKLMKQKDRNCENLLQVLDLILVGDERCLVDAVPADQQLIVQS